MIRRSIKPARQPRPPRRARRRPSPAALAAAGVPAALVLVIASSKSDVGAVFDHLRDGDGWWLAVAGAFEAVSFGGYITLFHTVIDADERRIGWTTSAQITLAGVVATRIFAAAGAGGLALSTWALHPVGMDSRTIARRMIALLCCPTASSAPLC